MLATASWQAPHSEVDVSEDFWPFRDEVRAFLRDHLPEHLRFGARLTPTVFAEPELGREWQAILHAKGWLAYAWPREYGGTGWSPVQRYIFEKECALADAPGLPSLGLKLLAPALYTYGTVAQKDYYLPRILSGEHYWCQGFSESGSGSDLASLKTQARLEGDRYVVNGTKLWTTHAHFADHIFCLVRTDSSVKPQRGISFLLIDMNQPGVSVRPILTLGGDHEVNEVVLENVSVPVQDRVGAEGEGWAIAKFLLENERGGSCHAPRLLADLTRLYATATAQPGGHGTRVADDPLFMAELARLELEAQALEVTELRNLEQLVERGRPGPQSSIVKLVASDLRRDVDALAMSVYGYTGLQLETRRPLYGNDAPEPVYSTEAQVASPRYLNSQAWPIFGGTNEIQRSIIAKTVLQL
jgi:alkylation response protein AidB-like acyl-CoA dehydrogenase